MTHSEYQHSHTAARRLPLVHLNKAVEQYGCAHLLLWLLKTAGRNLLPRLNPRDVTHTHKEAVCVKQVLRKWWDHPALGRLAPVFRSASLP